MQSKMNKRLPQHFTFGFMIACRKFGLPMTEFSVFFDVSHARYHCRKIIERPQLTKVLSVKGNTETKHRHDGPSPGIVVGVASATRMRPGVRERPKWNTELIHWVRHLSVSVRKERMGGGHGGDFGAVVC